MFSQKKNAKACFKKDKSYLTLKFMFSVLDAIPVQCMFND